VTPPPVVTVVTGGDFIRKPTNEKEAVNYAFPIR
jgi:hypothetical protein